MLVTGTDTEEGGERERERGRESTTYYLQATDNVLFLRSRVGAPANRVHRSTFCVLYALHTSPQQHGHEDVGESPCRGACHRQSIGHLRSLQGLSSN